MKKLNCIMVIDDDDPTNFINRMVIEEANCTEQLEIIESGKEALSYLKKAVSAREISDSTCVPDLVFLDINMPRMNGWEFLQEYEKIKTTAMKNTIIIMLTTSINPDDQLRAETIPQVAAFENKPLTSDMIERVISKYCNV